MFHISVTIAPHSEMNLAHDVRILKSALLYGDKVSLFSANSNMLLILQKLATLKESERLSFIVEILPSLVNTKNAEESSRIIQAIMIYKQLKSKKGKTNKEVLIQKTTESKFKAAWKEVEQNVYNQLNGTDLNSILMAVNSGIVELVEPSNTTDTEKMITAYLEFLEKSVNSLNTYPMFDNETASFLQSADYSVKGNEITNSRARQAGIALSLFNRLPNFNQAKVDEIVDLRSELNRPLTNFRGLLVQFSKEIQSSSWDENFQGEVDELFISKVAPAINEIEDECKANSAISHILSRPTETILTVMGAEIAPSIVGLNVQLAHVLGAIKIGSGLYTSLKEYRDTKQKIEAKPLYFYHAARKRLN